MGWLNMTILVIDKKNKMEQQNNLIGFSIEKRRVYIVEPDFVSLESLSLPIISLRY